MNDQEIRSLGYIKKDEAFTFIRDNFTASEVFDVVEQNSFDDTTYQFIIGKIMENPEYLKRFLRENPYFLAQNL